MEGIDYAEVTAVSIHAPRVGSDAGYLKGRATPWLFQSTLPAWGATSRHHHGRAVPERFNPRSPRGERPP